MWLNNPGTQKFIFKHESKYPESCGKQYFSTLICALQIDAKCGVHGSLEDPLIPGITVRKENNLTQHVLLIDNNISIKVYCISISTYF